MDGWKLFGQKCYKVIKKFGNWKISHTMCTRAGGDFAEIGSVKINDFLVTSKWDIRPKDQVWIGLHRSNGHWAWKRKEGESAANFTDWKSGEPEKDCAFMMFDPPKTVEWSTSDCAHIGAAVLCEKGKHI